MEVEQRRRHQLQRGLQQFHGVHGSSSGAGIQSKLAHLALDKRPFFHQTVTQITVQEGENAFFACKVENVHNQTVLHEVLNDENRFKRW